MPAQQLANNVAINIALYDVLGFDSQERATFVGHVALASSMVSSSQGTPAGVRLVHMTPPLLVGSPVRDPAKCHGHVGLDEPKRRVIEAFVRRLESEYAAEAVRRRLAGTWDQAAKDQFRSDQYTIRPHVRWPDGDRPYHQLSCAGFVQEAYEEAGIPLVDTDDANLPTCSLDTLKTAYAVVAAHLEDTEFRVQKGLNGDGPWPILLPGYIMNSLDRDRDEILSSPFHATPGDECFPREQTTVEGSS